MQRLRVDADWVLAEAINVYQRCMQKEKVVDRDGNFTGEFRFDAANSLKALNLIGQHVSAKVFEEKQIAHQDRELMERLQRARSRNKAPLSTPTCNNPGTGQGFSTPDAKPLNFLGTPVD